MEPREIPFERLVLPIVDEPTSMRLRLDFADWLAKNGYKPRARWFRQVCDYCARPTPLGRGPVPLEESHGTGTIALADVAALEVHLVAKWEECRPGYWRKPEGAQERWHFGRIALWVVSYPVNVYPALGETTWLTTAFREGWLEAVSCYLLDAEQVRTLLGWPEAVRALPLHINPTRCLAEGFDNRLMEGLLTLEGLRGLTVCPDEIAFPCMKRFSELARNLRYLQLLSLKRTGPSYRILEHLPHFPELRHLVIGQNLPQDEHVGAFAAMPKLQCLYLCGHDVTDKGLLAVQHIRTLRTVLVGSRRVTRAGIYALREARPDLRVVAIDDTKERLGPA